MLQCVAVCCSVLQCCCSVSLSFAVLTGVSQDQHCALQCVCSVLQCVAVSGCVFLCVGVCRCVLQCERVSFKTSIVRCSVFAACQSVFAACCSVLLGVAACCSVDRCRSRPAVCLQCVCGV